MSGLKGGAGSVEPVDDLREVGEGPGQPVVRGHAPRGAGLVGRVSWHDSDRLDGTVRAPESALKCASRWR